MTRFLDRLVALMHRRQVTFFLLVAGVVVVMTLCYGM